MSCIILFVLALLIVAMRLRTYGEPVNRDPATYSIIAREMLHGRQLYADVWDSKPPLIFVTYAAAQSVAGFGYSAICLLSAAGSIIAMLGVFYAASAGARGPVAGLIAAAAYALAASDYRLEGNEANTELFMNACLAWAFGLLLRIGPRRVSLRRAFAVGVLVSIASLYKTVAVAHAVGFAAAYLVGFRRVSRLRIASTNVAAMGLGALIPWLAAFGWAWVGGALGVMLEAVFGYNRFYSSIAGSGVGGNLARSFLPQNLASPAMLISLPLLVTIALGVMASRHRRLSRPMILVAGYAAASHVAVAMPGQFTAHYYQLWMPPLCIAAAWACRPLAGWLGRHGASWRSWPAVGLVGTLALFQLPLLTLSADDWATMKYGADPLIERKSAGEIASLLQPGETFYVWGSVPGLYFFADRRPPSAFFFIGPMLAGALREKATRRLVADLGANRPELLVLDERDVPLMPRNAAVEWFGQHYRLLSRDSVSGRFVYWARIGGRLAGGANSPAHP